MKKRLAKEARLQEIQAKNSALGKKVKELTSAKGMKGRGEASFYRVTCKVCSISLHHCISCSIITQKSALVVSYVSEIFFSHRIMEEECHMMIYQICLAEVSYFYVLAFP